ALTGQVIAARTRREEQSSISSRPLADLGGLEASGYIIACSLGGCRHFPRLEVPTVGKNAPSDARQLVGERDGEDIVVQSPFGASSQGLRPWRSQLFSLISTTQAAWTNRTLNVIPVETIICCPAGYRLRRDVLAP